MQLSSGQGRTSFTSANNVVWSVMLCLVVIQDVNSTDVLDKPPICGRICSTHLLVGLNIALFAVNRIWDLTSRLNS
jgi:hypothetical protein